MTRFSTKKTLRAMLLGSVTLGLAGPAAAAESDSLEQQLRALQQEVQQLKQQQERDWTAAPANAVTAGDIPGSFKLPGTDTSIAIGGYAKGDVIMNLDHDVGDSFAPSAIPTDGAEEETSFRLHARQTRLNFTSHTPTEFGTARIYVEGDFFGAGGNEIFSNSTSFRLRHAYGELGPLLVGQTWTLFMPLASLPDTVDFFGPAGISTLRQGQVRYTHQMASNFSVAVSVENPQLTATAFDGTVIGSRNSVAMNDPEAPGLDSVPDFVGAVQYDDGGVHLKLSGVLRQLEVDGDITDADGDPVIGDVDDDELGYGIALAAAVDVAPTTTLLGNFVWGDGVGRYILNGFGQDAFVDDAGTLDTIEAWSFYGGISHSWTPEVTSNVAYGHYNIRDRFFEDQTKNLHTVHVNTWWAPVDQARFGLEYIHGRRNFEDGSLDNSANRVQFGAQYFF